MEAFCVKCKKKCIMVGGTETTNAKGRRMAKGKCPVCSTVVCRILPSK